MIVDVVGTTWESLVRSVGQRYIICVYDGHYACSTGPEGRISCVSERKNAVSRVEVVMTSAKAAFGECHGYKFWEVCCQCQASPRRLENRLGPGGGGANETTFASRFSVRVY